MIKWYNIEKSALLTFFGIILLFSTAILVVLLAPRHIDPTWTEPTSDYQVQMYEVADPNIYIGNPSTGGYDLQFVYHLQDGFSLIALTENEFTKIIAPDDLKEYITGFESPLLKLTSHLLMLRKPQGEMVTKAELLVKDLFDNWEKKNPNWKIEKLLRPSFEVLELFRPQNDFAFAVGSNETIINDWVDKNFKIMDNGNLKATYHSHAGVIYVKNPVEYKISYSNFTGAERWYYDPNGKPVQNVEELKKLHFSTRQELIHEGEEIYKREGCWYCHTDQTRTLIQDTVSNGSESFPAPPSSANEYIYQETTFPGTRRIGPDLSREGIKQPSRDWHRGHFWSPKTASIGSVMPSFQHFFDTDPRGTSRNQVNIPNFKFEAIYQYMMTKGTRITPPNQGWWIGKDPINTLEIIEGRRGKK
jgi:cytochrome c oxidase cbb3-type subunit 2